MKINTPLVGVGIGGGASALTQIALRMGLAEKLYGDGSSKVRVAVANNPGIVGMVVGSAGAGVLFALKKKDAAIGALIGAAAASLPAVVADIRKLAATTTTTPVADKPPGFGLAVASRSRGSMGAPVIELFGAPARNVEVFGAPQSGNASFNPAAFGGGNF